MILAIYNCISIPFNAAFTPESSVGYEIFESGVDLCFAIDILLNFRTTYVDKKTGLEVISQRRIAWSYIAGGRFFIDLGASIPFERIYLIIGGSAGGDGFKLLGLLKLVRLLRLSRVIRYMKFKTGLKIVSLGFDSHLFLYRVYVYSNFCSSYC